MKISNTKHSFTFNLYWNVNFDLNYISCPVVLFLLAIVLSVLRCTDSDYPFGIFKHFLLMLCVVYLYLDCNNGTFGDGCLFQCYCQSGFCDKISGICPDKLCQPGWIGNSCSEGIWLKQFSTSPNEQHLEISLFGCYKAQFT